MQLRSPAELGENFQTGLAIGDSLQRTALDSAAIRAQHKVLQEQMKPITLDKFTAAVPEFLRPHVLALADSQGIIEQNGDMQYVRGGNAKAFIDQFKSNKVWQATVYDQANQTLQKELSPLQEQYSVHKERWTNLMQNYKDQYEQAVDEKTGRPDQIKRNKIEAQIHKEQQENQDFVNMNKLEKQITALSGTQMKALQVLGVIDEGFKKDVEKYGEEAAIRLSTGITTRVQLDEQKARMEARARAEEVRQTKMLENSLKSEEWTEPYMTKIGGKPMLVQKNKTTGEIKKIGEDKSVTVNVGQQMGQSDIDILADKLGRGVINPSELSKRAGNQQIAQIFKRAEELHPGFDPQGNKAENAAYQATLTQQTKQRGAVGSFVRNINDQIATVNDIFKYLQRTDARGINIPIRELKTRLAGSGLENKYDMFISEISAESSKLSQSAAQSIAQLPEGSRQKWEKIHDLNLPIKEMKVLLEGTREMGQIRLKSLDDEIADTKKRRKSEKGSPAKSNLPTGFKEGW